jgi:hypothetical protein
MVVMSKLTSLGADLKWKGQTLENHVVDLFRQHHLEASRINRQIDGVEFECDCIILWGEVLLVVECKNYCLPRDNPQGVYWFLKEQSEAIEQVQAKLEIIAGHPELVTEALGHAASWNAAIPIVLNGTPFSLCGDIDGVYVFDTSALRRFLEEGWIGPVGISSLGENAESRVIQRTKLWAGDGPDIADLIRQLQAPAQVVQELAMLRRSSRLVAISRNVHIRTTVIESGPSWTDRETDAE